MEERNKNLVNKYYSMVDLNNFDEVFKLFEENIEYNRCGFKIKGIKNLKSFFLNKRTIRGIHKINHIITEGNSVATMGVFYGINAANINLQLHFSDFYFFNNNGLITRRNTYLATGLESTL